MAMFSCQPVPRGVATGLTKYARARVCAPYPSHPARSWTADLFAIAQTMPGSHPKVAKYRGFRATRPQGNLLAHERERAAKLRAEIFKAS
jgi:hypothetical protein